MPTLVPVPVLETDDDSAESAALDVIGWCRAAEQWAADEEDVTAIREAQRRLSMIDRYLATKSDEGRREVAAAMRRLEMRIGELLGPAERGGDRRSDQVDRDLLDDGLTRYERRDFRDMAEHRDEVEQIIDESSDEHPASRRSVLAAIRPPSRERDESEKTTKLRVEFVENPTAEQPTADEIRNAMTSLRKDRHLIAVQGVRRDANRSTAASSFVVAAPLDDIVCRISDAAGQWTALIGRDGPASEWVSRLDDGRRARLVAVLDAALDVLDEMRSALS